MEELAGNEKESKLLQVISQLSETNQKQQADLNEKEILIKSLQERIAQLESGGVETSVNFLQAQENMSLDSQPMEMDLTDYDSNENASKKMKGEISQVVEPTNSDDNSAQTKALRNPLILTKILKSIRTRDLIQNSRLVNREWRDLSNDILLKRKNVKVRLVEDNSKFVLVQKNSFYTKHIPEKSLDELTSLLKTSTRFPCVNFSFPENLERKDAQTFLSQFGSNIKGLHVEEEQSSKFMRKLFVEQVPNLESLELKNVVVEGELFLPNYPKLSCLISLELWGPDEDEDRNSTSLIKEILEAAPNLQSCTGCWSVEQIELLGPRVHILKDLMLTREDSKDLDSLEKLTKMKLQLKYLDMDYYYCFDNHVEERFAKFDRINSNILSLNRMTLEKIRLTPHTLFDNHIEWPELINVVELWLCGIEDYELKYPSFKFSKTFPKLHTLYIENYSHSDGSKEDDDMECPVPFRDAAPSVKTLDVNGSLVKISPLHFKNFPNVQHLSLHVIKNKDFARLAPAIWNMKKLKTLKLTGFDCTTSQSDAGFTGMKEDTCQFLRNSGRDKMQVEDMEKFRVDPSILNLTELEELVLDDPGRDKTELDGASSVSFKYAFNLMPKLFIRNNQL